MISQSKFDIQQSGNTMNSKRNSNRTIFKLLQQFDFIERKNIYIYIFNSQFALLIVSIIIIIIRHLRESYS